MRRMSQAMSFTLQSFRFLNIWCREGKPRILWSAGLLGVLCLLTNPILASEGFSINEVLN
jgi:hypothetical protein